MPIDCCADASVTRTDATLDPQRTFAYRSKNMRGNCDLKRSIVPSVAFFCSRRAQRPTAAAWAGVGLSFIARLIRVHHFESFAVAAWESLNVAIRFAPPYAVSTGTMPHQCVLRRDDRCRWSRYREIAVHNRHLTARTAAGCDTHVTHSSGGPFL